MHQTYWKSASSRVWGLQKRVPPLLISGARKRDRSEQKMMQPCNDSCPISGKIHACSAPGGPEFRHIKVESVWLKLRSCWFRLRSCWVTAAQGMLGHAQAWPRADSAFTIQEGYHERAPRGPLHSDTLSQFSVQDISVHPLMIPRCTPLRNSLSKAETVIIVSSLRPLISTTTFYGNSGARFGNGIR